MNQIDRILKEQAAIQYNLRQLCKMRTDERGEGKVAALIDCAIESLRDAVESLKRAVEESEA